MNNAVFSNNIVKHIARVSKIPITPQEENEATLRLNSLKNSIQTIDDILPRICRLKSINRPAGESTHLRSDQVQLCFSQKEALSGALKKHKGYFVVPMILKSKKKSRHK